MTPPSPAPACPAVTAEEYTKGIAKKGSGARLSGKLYREWITKVRDYDRIKAELAAKDAAIAAVLEASQKVFQAAVRVCFHAKQDRKVENDAVVEITGTTALDKALTEYERTFARLAALRATTATGTAEGREK